MRFWAFDNSYVGENSSIGLVSGRKVRIGESDKIVLFERTYDDLVFVSHGLVTSVITERKDETTYLFKARLEKHEVFDEKRYLEDFSFSLEKIYRFNKPLLHFCRPYVLLSQHDYNTIIHANIYWARTAFGLFINQLPSEHIVRFMRNLAEKDPDILLQRSGYIRAWKSLRSFIEQEFITAAQILRAIRERVEEYNAQTETIIDYGLLAFSTDEEIDIADSIENQEHLLSQFIESLRLEDGETNLLDEIDRRLEEQTNNNEIFEAIFRHKPWPIQMIES